ncbi:hypothetical protein EC973_005001 [Apophysomyces ossiformis]|uniref:Glycoside hydrolase family 125 protein n=1 Tax=Apophysomyces ossiformis TaxID=679940 RepID=A0A8H7BGC4_9FUNG|nr:hypothetical protein EC973_005001 [Apophysomyces ossiformis]
MTFEQPSQQLPVSPPKNDEPICRPGSNPPNSHCRPLPTPPPINNPPEHYGIPDARPVKSERKFSSPAVDDFLSRVTQNMRDKDLAMLLNNCLPNTLDTTIEWFKAGKDPRTFLITGDIPAMWIRDSTNQILPYMIFAHNDTQIQELILGVILVQSTFLYYDPYANAFLKPWYAPSGSTQRGAQDRVIPQYDPAYVWESKLKYEHGNNKYELDSLAHFFQLANEYMEATGDYERVVTAEDWLKAVPRVFQVIHDQMKGTWEEEEEIDLYKLRRPMHQPGAVPEPVSLEHGYRFKRTTDRPTETLGANGRGGVSRWCGLVRSAFRPSDDATSFPYLIPANAQLSVQLEKLAVLLERASQSMITAPPQLADFAAEAKLLGNTIRKAIYDHAIVTHPVFGRIFAFEVDGYGSSLLMDDANTPSLLSLPVLGFVDVQDEIYLNTRAFVLSNWNPWYFEGNFGNGIGGPHTGKDMIWPMSLLMQIQTSTSEEEIKANLNVLKRLARKSGLMCESFHKDNPSRFTRAWFSWANGLAGRTILHIMEKYPHLV